MINGLLQFFYLRRVSSNLKLLKKVLVPHTIRHFVLTASKILNKVFHSTFFWYPMSYFRKQTEPCNVLVTKSSEVASSHQEAFKKKAVTWHKWDKVFKNEPSKICSKRPLKNLKGYGLHKQTMSLQIFYRLSSTNFTWFILEYFDPNVLQLRSKRLKCT